MTSLDDLVRETLAARAHDVDRVQLNAPVPRPVRSRRWVAVGTVVAVAAAVVVAVVLVAPWRGGPDRNAVGAIVSTPPDPPAAMQWVSFHGITLTVPATWTVRADDPCDSLGAVGLVRIEVSALEHPCATTVGQQPPTTVRLYPLADQPPQGEPTTVGSHPARRFVSFGGPAARAYVQYQLVAVGVGVRVDAAAIADADALVDGIEFTPVDHYGCTAGPPSTAGGSSGRVSIAHATAGVVCEYDSPGASPAGSLLGSRVLSSSDLAALRTVLDTAEPAPEAIAGTGRLGPHNGLHVYELVMPDGTAVRVSIDLSGNPVVVSDGQHVGVLPQGPTDPVDAPSVYP